MGERQSRVGLVLGLAAATVLAADQRAIGAGISGAGGHVRLGSQAGCFDVVVGSIRNNGGTGCISNPVPEWVMWFAVNQGSHVAIVNGSNLGGNLTCLVNATTQDGAIVQQQVLSFPSNGGTMTLSTSVTVPNSGSMLVDCSVGPGNFLNSVNF